MARREAELNWSGIILVVFLALSSGAQAYPTTSDESQGKPQLTTQPVVIVPGLTERFSVRCSTGANPDSADGSLRLISLELSVSDDTSYDHEEHRLVSISIWSQQPYVSEATGSGDDMTVAGSIDPDTGLASLELTWTQPTGQRAGTYKCTAQGLDGSGRPVSASMSSQVIEINSWRLDQLEEHVQTLSGHIEEATVGSLARLAQLEASEKILRSRQDAILGWFRARFDASHVFNGTRYYLTRQDMPSFQPELADAQCQVLGGYLVEFDSRAEYDFVKSFFLATRGQSITMFSGGNDRQENGKWVYLHSGRPVTFTSWGPAQPDNAGPTGEDCLELRVDPHGAGFIDMNDLPCSFGGKFLCEVPQ